MKKIAIIPNYTKDKDLLVTKKLVNLLQKNATIYMSDFYKDSGIDAIYEKENLYKNVDVVIVLGGDGTILQVAEPASKLGISVMGINLGRIGFMTETEISNMETAIEKLLAGDYETEERMMMKIKLYKNNGEIFEYYALNDAVISKATSEMIFIELYREDEKINAYMADGMVIATPTGSTGYSLSAGGPVADPVTELFIATPVCAHSLSSRSAILTSDKIVKIKITDTGSNKADLTVDGQVKQSLEVGEKIEIEKALEKMKIIKMTSQSFYDILTEKLS